MMPPSWPTSDYDNIIFQRLQLPNKSLIQLLARVKSCRRRAEKEACVLACRESDIEFPPTFDTP